jgi:hypothetical protein
MVCRSWHLLCLVAATLTCIAVSSHAGAPGDLPRGGVAFVHVNVVPMDRERVLEDQTVLVEGDRIVAIGKDVPIPADARIIDGQRSAYLSPGLADMHSHSDTRNDLAIYLANGVTTILTMGGNRSTFIDWTVPAANAGTIPGPHVYTSLIVDGTPEYGCFLIKTPAEARAIVDLARTNGYDFMKVYNNLAPEVFAALADEGHRQHMPVVGHGVTQVGLERQLAAGQVLVAHTEEFFYTFFSKPGSVQTDTPPDVRRIPEAIALVKRYNAAVTADPATYGAIARQIGRRDVVDAFLSTPDIRYLAPNDRLRWRLDTYVDKTAKLTPKYEFLKIFLKAMADAGVLLVAGTDAPAVPGMFPGFSLHQDLAELEGAGLTRFQALSTATRMPGEFIARTKQGDAFGTVSVGSRADLILSTDNPLANLASLRTPIGVMAHGQWRDAADLRALEDAVAAQYRIATQSAESVP